MRATRKGTTMAFDRTKKVIAFGKNVANMTAGEAVKGAVVGTARGLVKGGKAASAAWSSKRRGDAEKFYKVATVVNRVARAARHKPNRNERDLSVDKVTVFYDRDVQLIWVVGPDAKLDAISDALTAYNIENVIRTIEKKRTIRVEVDAALNAEPPV